MVKKSPDEAPAIFSNELELLQVIGKEKGKEYPFK